MGLSLLIRVGDGLVWLVVGARFGLSLLFAVRVVGNKKQVNVLKLLLSFVEGNKKWVGSSLCGLMELLFDVQVGCCNWAMGCWLDFSSNKSTSIRYTSKKHHIKSQEQWPLLSDY